MFLQVIFLEKNLILADGIMPDLKTGTYCTDGYVVKINGNIVIPKGSTFYYDASTRTLSWLTGYAKYINGEWEDKPKRGCQVVESIYDSV